MTMQILLEVLPLDVFLGNVVESLNLTDIVDLDNVGLHQTSRRLSLKVKAAHIVRISSQIATKNLESHLPF